MKLMRSAGCKPVVKIFDTDDYLNPCYSYELGTKKIASIDLHDMKSATGKPIDPSHIYMVGIETDGSQTVYLNTVYPSLDGDSPATGIESIRTEQPRSVTNQDFYDLTGRKVMKPTRGIYIQHGKKVLVK